MDFRMGQSVLDLSFNNNEARLTDVIAFLKGVEQSRDSELTGVTFCGSASPEGSISINKRLSAERCHALERYVRKHVSLPDSIVTIKDGYIDWEKLASLVEQSDMPHKHEALCIMREGEEFTFDRRGVLVDSRKKRMMDHYYGRTWQYMQRNFFGEIRNASVILVTTRQRETPKQEPAPTPVVLPTKPRPDATPVVEHTDEQDTIAADEPKERKPFYMAVKTNMLYDALAVPNLGVEFYLGHRWSVAANWMYGWWNKNSRHRYWRVYGGDLTVRKWLGRQAQQKPLTGHHLGLYGQVFTFDFEWGGKGYMGGKPGGTLWERANYAAGIEYGYSLPLAHRLSLDCTLGVGYWGGTYYEYTPLDGHYVWQATKKRHWVGPTNAEVSLVWLIGRGNVNTRKGGAR